LETIPTIQDSGEELIVEPTPTDAEPQPLLADSDQNLAADDNEQDFLAALADTIDNEEEAPPSTNQAEESEESVDADLNDFFKSFE